MDPGPAQHVVEKGEHLPDDVIGGRGISNPPAMGLHHCSNRGLLWMLATAGMTVILQNTGEEEKKQWLPQKGCSVLPHRITVQLYIFLKKQFNKTRLLTKALY